MHFLKTFWRMLFFWKMLLAVFALGSAAGVQSLEPNDFNLHFSAAIKAPLFALISAATLFIGMIPKRPGPNDVFADVLVRIVGASTACLAGWYWLEAETDGNPSKYLSVLAPLFTLLMLIIVVFPFLSSVTTLFLDGSRSQDRSENE